MSISTQNHTSNRNTNANDLLNLNMQNICNELDAMLIGTERELNAAGREFGNNPMGMDLAMQYYNNNQMQHQAPVSVNNLRINALNELYIESGPGGYGHTQITQQQAPLQYGNSQPQLGSYIVNTPSCSTPIVTTKQPQFEFHYLQTNSKKAPLISSAVRPDEQNIFMANNRRYIVGGVNTGAIRKYQKPFKKTYEAAREEEIDYDKIVVDLAAIGLSIDNKEKSAVLRIFTLFRKLHYYLDETLTTADCKTEMYGYIWLPTPKSSMPSTLNVQHQIKQAARKCAIFLCDKEEILNSNKMICDREMYLECERRLNSLRMLLSDFELYKRVELEHKRCEFLNGEAIVKAERLELLMEQLIVEIRQCNFSVYLFNWLLEKQYNRELAPMCTQQQEQQFLSSPSAASATNINASDDLGYINDTKRPTANVDANAIAAANNHLYEHINMHAQANYLDCQITTEHERELRYIG